MLVEGAGRIRLDRGVKVHNTRPAVDPLFESAAAAFGRRVVGVILSGRSRDGAIALKKIKDQGGLALVHDPEEAAVPQMPAAAVAEANAEVLRIDLLAHRVAQFCAGKGGGKE
jgi:two-component system chemotaxis response regulator CheB